MVRSCDRPRRVPGAIRATHRRRNRPALPTAAAILSACALVAITLWASEARAAPAARCCIPETDPCAAALCSLPPVAASGLTERDRCHILTESAAAAPTDEQDDEDVLAVPICLIEGASGIAPLLVHPIADGRIKALPDGSDESPLPQQLLPSSSDEQPRMHTGDGHAAAIASQGPVLRRPVGVWRQLPRQLPRLSLAPGYAGRVYRPPRR